MAVLDRNSPIRERISRSRFGYATLGGRTENRGVRSDIVLSRHIMGIDHWQISGWHGIASGGTAIDFPGSGDDLLSWQSGYRGDSLRIFWRIDDRVRIPCGVLLLFRLDEKSNGKFSFISHVLFISGFHRMGQDFRDSAGLSAVIFDGSDRRFDDHSSLSGISARTA